MKSASCLVYNEMLSLYSRKFCLTVSMCSDGTRICTRFVSPPLSASYCRLLPFVSVREVLAQRQVLLSMVVMPVVSVLIMLTFWIVGAIDMVHVFDM